MFSSQNSQVSSAANYIEDVFNTYVWTGTGSNQTLTTGVDTSTYGGLFWTKNRTNAYDHALWPTALSLSGNYLLKSNTTGAATYGTYNTGDYVSNSTTGVTVYGNSSQNYVTWTFRKQPKFFDVVTYTGNETAGKTVNHSLGSDPGCIIIKRISPSGYNWFVYHRSNPTKYTNLNLTNAETNFTIVTSVSSTNFTLPADASTNANGIDYVAYLFAHNAGGFGLTGTDNVISCGSYTGNGSSTGPTITLGYEPQWVMIKKTSDIGNWHMHDIMRDMSVTSNSLLWANLSDAEVAGASAKIAPLATGFQITNSTNGENESGGTYIYIAIRRGPMKVPTSGTSVFDPVLLVDGSTNIPPVNSTINAPDLAWSFARNAVYGYGSLPRDRLSSAGMSYLQTSSTAAEASYSAYTFGFTTLQKGIDGANSGSTFNQASPGVIYWMFGRAPSFFDVVCYTGTGSARTVTHNLGVVPELMIVKKRSAADAWIVYANNDNTDYLVLNTTAATVDDNTIWNDTSPTASVFTVGTNDDVNGNTATFVAYLFATCPGVSKVGTYTGTGSTLQIDCGFTGGARFVLIKRTDSTGDWYVWDTARGIVSGNDPYLLLNSAAAEVTNTDYIDTYSAGFEISSTAPAAINASGGTFIFLAIA